MQFQPVLAAGEADRHAWVIPASGRNIRAVLEGHIQVAAPDAVAADSVLASTPPALHRRISGDGYTDGRGAIATDSDAGAAFAVDRSATICRAACAALNDNAAANRDRAVGIKQQPQSRAATAATAPALAAIAAIPAGQLVGNRETVRGARRDHRAEAAAATATPHGALASLATPLESRRRIRVHIAMRPAATAAAAAASRRDLSILPIPAVWLASDATLRAAALGAACSRATSGVVESVRRWAVPPGGATKAAIGILTAITIVGLRWRDDNHKGEDAAREGGAAAQGGGSHDESDCDGCEPGSRNVITRTVRRPDF
ncbi:MAG: hypothetical protein ACK4VM_17355 [Bosea sp. (in: a-proteobacteria)]